MAQHTRNNFYWIHLMHKRALSTPQDAHYDKERTDNASQWFATLVKQIQQYLKGEITIYQVDRLYLEYVTFLPRDEETKKIYLGMNSESLSAEDYANLDKTISQGRTYNPFMAFA